MKRLLILLFIISSLLTAQNIDTLDYKICINAGHGGHDSNDRPPVTPAGFWESEGNLTKALALETILKEYGVADIDDSTRARFRIVMTRRNNRTEDDLALSSIAAMANSNNSDWMQSIHSNAFNGTAHYTLILYPGPDGDPRINGLAGYPSCPEEETFAVKSGTNIRDALRTGALYTRGDWSFYGTGKPYLGVFRTLQVPGTLSEGTFHDYYPETFRLQNLDFRINESWAIAVSFMDFYGLPEPEFANLAGIVRTREATVDYYYKSGSLDKFQPVDSIEVTLKPGGRVYRGNTTMYVDEYTPQWSKAGPGDYYTNGANNNDGNNRNNGFYLFDSLAYGDYTLVFDAPGYWKDSVDVTVSDSRFFQYENFFLVSSVPPFVRTFSPTDHESMHPAWEPVILEFSHTMDTASVEKGLELTPYNDLIMSWNSDNSKLTLTASGDTLDVETSYTLTLKADSVLGNRSQHLDGNADGVGGDDFVLHFTTSPEDIYPPEVVDFYPPRSLSHDDLQPVISFFFDEKIDTSGGDIREKFALIRTSGANTEIPTVFDMYIVDNKTVVSLFPTEELVRNYRYARYAYEGIRDHAGNVTTGDQVSSLRIDDEIPWYADTLVIDPFGPGLTGHWKQPGYSGSTENLADGETSANDSIVNHASGSGHSMEIYYKFDASAGSAFLREWLDGSSAQAGRQFTDESILQAWVFGDGSGNLFRFAVDDAGGEGVSEVSPWYPLDFTGWKLLKWDLRTGETGDWADVSDGTLDGTLSFDSFQIQYNDSLGNHEGTLYIEDLWVLTPGDVAVQETDLPGDFILEQNYPNPFNPFTTIPYRLSAGSHVDLAVYDLNGKRVKQLVREHQDAGMYRVDFDAGHLPSGIYIARLQTERGVMNRKMLLVK